MKRFTILLLVLIFSLSCGTSGSFTPMQATNDNVALEGFDPVSYFADGAAKGNPQHEVVWKGVKWLFSNSENLKEFRDKPEKYAPEFGGYCAFSVAEGKVVRSDPTVYKVVNGKLYLLNTPEAKAKWEANQTQMTESGIKNWKHLTKESDSGFWARMVDYALILVSVYLLVGVIFAIYFVAFQIDKFDIAPKNSSTLFRLIIFPGAVVFWSLLLIFNLRNNKDGRDQTD